MTDRHCALCGAPMIPTPGKRGFHCSASDSNKHRLAVERASARIMRNESNRGRPR